jgi:hypothetical protein
MGRRLQFAGAVELGFGRAAVDTCWRGPETCDGRLRRLDIGALLGA